MLIIGRRSGEFIAFSGGGVYVVRVGVLTATLQFWSVSADGEFNVRPPIDAAYKNQILWMSGGNTQSVDVRVKDIVNNHVTLTLDASTEIKLLRGELLTKEQKLRSVPPQVHKLDE